MNLALQRKRLFIAMSVTVASLIVAMAAVVGSFAFHLGWALWVFVAAVLVGFGSHGWLMLGAWRDRSAS